MKKRATITCASILFTLTNSAFSTPIQAVIGLDSSQVVESNKQISLTPNNATFFPLEENFAPISLPTDGTYSNWINEIGNKVTIEHKQRNLSYTGTILKVDANLNRFQISIDGQLAQLPLSDFYLIPLNNKSKSPINSTYPSNTSYQTNQLSWTPQLNLIINNGNIDIYQNALLHNNSDSFIELKNSLLHFSHTQPSKMYDAESLPMMTMKAAAPTVDYQNNEASYPLGDTLISLPPHSDTLYPIQHTKSKVERTLHVAKLYTHDHSRGVIDLSFQNHLQLTFSKDGFPGEYQIFWKRNKLLIPANKVFFHSVRQKQKVTITTNKSLDLTGTIKLVSATSASRLTTQIWEAEIENNSNQLQNFSIEQGVEGILEKVEDSTATKISANTVKLAGKINPNSKKVIRYTLTINK